MRPICLLLLLLEGVTAFTQSEGGSHGSPEMSFLYELGVSELVSSIDQLMLDPNASQPREGVVDEMHIYGYSQNCQ